MKYFIRHLFTGLFTALLFSAFIYLAYYGFTNKLLNTLLGLAAFALLLYIPKRSILFSGFFIGLLWFYWIGYSFKYDGVGYMTPFITLGFGLLYLLFFAPLALTNKPYIRAIFLFILSFVEPLGWNWMKLELPFVDSYIGVYKYQFVALLLALSLPALIKNRKYKALPLLLLLVAFNYGYPPQHDAPIKIKLVATHIKQEDKWQSKNLNSTVDMIFNEIAQATQEGYDLVVFPESVFPLYMNKNPLLIAQLLEASKHIDIIAGSLLRENHLNYNVTYFFQNQTYKIAKKLVLVPFGEYIPLPSFMQKFINDTFFAGASDFVTAKKPTDFIIKGIKFRNAICYEATCQKLYNGDVKYMIAISNNAWFLPSIEPTLQKLLMEYYGRKNGVTVYHSANMAGTGVVK